MRRFLAFVSIAIALITASIAGSACTARPSPCGAGESPTLRVAYADARGSAAQFRGFPVTYWTDATVVWTDGHGRPTPGLAQTWQRTDARTWTFTLRPDLRTHNGQPFTADRIRTSLLEQVPNLTTPEWRDLQAIDAPTPTTLVFRFARPFSQLPEALMNLNLGHGLEDPEFGAGPWRVTEQRRDHVNMVRFGPIVHAGANPARLEIQAYPDMRTAWAAFLRNEVDVVHDVAPSAVPSLSQNPDIRLHMGPPGGVYVMGFRPRRLLRDVRVRQAINLAINRQDLLQHRYGGQAALVPYAKPTAGPFSPEYWAMEGRDWRWPYDLMAARALLKEALGDRTDPIELTCITTSEVPEIADIAANVEAQLRRVHIRLRLEPLAHRPLVERLSKGDFDAYIMQMTTGHAGLWAYIFWRSDQKNPNPVLNAGYTGADEALDQMYHADSPDAERAAVHAVMEAMRRDPPAAFLITRPIIRGVRSTWHVPDEGREISLSIDRWTLDPPCGAR